MRGIDDGGGRKGETAERRGEGAGVSRTDER